MSLVDVETAVTAAGLLRSFNEAGVLDLADVHVAQRLCALGRETDDRVALAAALAVRALRGGSVCVDMSTIAEAADGLPWPDAEQWLTAVRASTLLADPPVLHLYDDRLLYLDRYRREEQQVCDDLVAMLVPRPSGPTAEVPAFERLFPPASKSSAARRKSRCRRA